MKYLFYRLREYAFEMEKDTPQKQKFADLLMVLSDVVHAVEVKEDYSKIEEVFDYIRGCERQAKTCNWD